MSGPPIGWQMMSPTKHRARDRFGILPDVKQTYPAAYEQQVSDNAYVYLTAAQGDRPPHLVGLSWSESAELWSFVILPRTLLDLGLEYSVFSIRDRLRIYPGVLTEPPAEAKAQTEAQPELEPDPEPAPKPVPEIRRFPMGQRHERQIVRGQRESRPARIAGTNMLSSRPNPPLPQLLKRATAGHIPKSDLVPKQPSVHIEPDRDGWVVAITNKDGDEIRSKPFRSYDEAAKSIE